MMTSLSSRDDPLALLNPPPNSSSPIRLSESYLFDASSSSNDPSAFLTSSDSVEDFGFSRPDFGHTPLPGSVHFYQRHLFLCYKHPLLWPPRIQAAEFDRLPRLLSASLASRKPNLTKITRLTLCEGHDGTDTSNGDVLIFPDMIRYRRLTHFDIDTFVEEVLVKDGEWLPGTREALRGWYIFVCCHGTRDRRCGACGPAVVNRFREEIESQSLQHKVSVSACSHIGGHKYAGNVIIFGPNSKKEINGHWYGYVTPDDVPRLIEQHILKREIIDYLWRGQMGLSEEDQIKAQEERLKIDEKMNVKSSENSTQCNEINTKICNSRETMQCCQANGSYACCQDPLSPEASNTSEFNKPLPKLSAEKKSYMKQVRQNKKGKGVPSRRVYSIPTWYENWEREDTYASLAVIGAAISVAFAYSCYKQIR